jgi:hypothetical protein
MVVLLMALRPTGRDHPNAIGTLGVCHLDENTATHANENNALLSIVLAIVDVLHGKRSPNAASAWWKASP